MTPTSIKSKSRPFSAARPTDFLHGLKQLKGRVKRPFFFLEQYLAATAKVYERKPADLIFGMFQTDMKIELRHRPPSHT